MSKYQSKNDCIVAWLDKHISNLPDDQAIQLFYLRRQALSNSRYIRGYKKYMLSDEWQALRLKVLDYYGYHCAVCSKDGDVKQFYIHHRTYNHFGSETISDLIPLCDMCHFYIHPTSWMTRYAYNLMIGNNYSGYITRIKALDSICQTGYHFQAISNYDSLLTFYMGLVPKDEYQPELWDIISLNKGHITETEWKGYNSVNIQKIPGVRLYKPDRPLALWKDQLSEILYSKELGNEAIRS